MQVYSLNDERLSLVYLSSTFCAREFLCGHAKSAHMLAKKLGGVLLFYENLICKLR